MIPSCPLPTIDNNNYDAPSLRGLIEYLRFVVIETPLRVFQWVSVTVCLQLIFLYWKYRSSIQKRLKKIDASLSRGLVYRDKLSKPSKVVKVLELHPAFVAQYKDSWQLCSLGEYLNTLRFITDADNDDNDDQQKQMMPQILERELQVAIGSAILHSFGPQIGRAFLPLLGVQRVESFMGQLVSRLLSWIIANVMVDGADQGWDPIGDKACLPFNVSELVGFVNLNQKIRSVTMEISPMEWMSRGEIGFDPTYYTPLENEAKTSTTKDEKGDNASPAHDKVLIPNPFIIEKHFEAAISGLEDRIRHQTESTDTSAQALAEPTMTTKIYDPNDRTLPEPQPINPTILPGLYMGWGDAKCTHTKREILRNRLFAVLLTKLSHNYQCRIKGNTNWFVVRIKGRDCNFPDEFVQALIDTGHTIEVCPRSAITTFGLAFCVKEEDDSWTNVPIAYFFQTGYERFDQRPAFFSAPHGGIDMKIKGPLVGTDPTTGESQKCDIQFYMAIEGLCAWHSNHNAEVPWIQSVSTKDTYDQKTALKAIRMSGLLACTFNSIGTEMNLPFGGYGVLGVCNDTAALVDFAASGTTNMYPLLSTGRFLMHTSAHLVNMHDKLSKYDDMKVIANDARRLASAACFMESDIHCSPTHLIGATRRFNANYPQSYFRITDDSREIMQYMATEYESFLHTTAKELEEKSQATFQNYLADQPSFKDDIESERESTPSKSQ
ncbi:hypothetical protein IV203_027509 [Nitzschia inconspicua]|uniref:Uncharacterized protein n=1 Tax=Nitzschia inconspicua TaxID=303405 RepID=A0A9K3Q3K7_9STRA|nr:hypothetical protein IV203_027509 [Nitzschia inconspicua]